MSVKTSLAYFRMPRFVNLAQWFTRFHSDAFSPGCYVISLKFFGRGSSYTFLESLEPIQLQEQCCHFFRHRPLTFLAVTTSGFTVFRGYTSDNATF